MRSLRARIIALTALVAVLSTAMCAAAAARAVAAGEAVARAAALDHARAQVVARLDELRADLAREAADAARADGLDARLPTPAAEWALVHLDPGARGGPARAYAIVVDDAVTARIRAGATAVGDHRAEADDPAHARALIALQRARGAAAGEALPANAAGGAARPTRVASGVADLGGAPAIWAAATIAGGQRAPATLIALRYLDADLLARLAPGGWTLTSAPSAHRADDEAAIAIGDGGDDGRSTWSLRLAADQGATRGIAARSQAAIFGAGVAAAAASIAVGLWLGWRWLRPIHLLAEACRARVLDPHQPLPSRPGLAEADVLADSLRALVEAERAGRDDLAAALTREATANAVHERFLAQLGHELGGPIRVLVAAIERLDAQGRLEPERIAVARATALMLEERFQEVLGLAGEIAGEAEPAATPLRADEYVAEVAELLAPLARRRGVALRVAAPAETLPIDRRLLTPVLVNLVSNALKASSSGAVSLALARDGGEGAWTVADAGTGIAPDLAPRIAAAFARGEVLPGEPGIGLGLALALANTRALRGTLRLLGTGAAGTTIELRVPIAVSTASWRRR